MDPGDTTTCRGRNNSPAPAKK